MGFIETENKTKASDDLMKLIATSKTEFVLYEDMTKVEDSLLFDSGTTIATLTTPEGKELAIEVRGEVRVEYDGTFYRYPTEFPEALKEMIADGSFRDSEEVIIHDGNWFEACYKYDEEYDTVDIEGCTPTEIYAIMADCVNLFEKRDVVPPQMDDKTVSVYLEYNENTLAQTRQKPSYEYAVEIANSDGKFERQVDVFSEYDEAVQYANIINHDADALLADEQVYVIRIDYNENGEEINTEPVRKFDRDERDANELFNEVLADVGFEIEAYNNGEEKGYRLFDKQLKEYFSFEGEDVVVSSTVETMDVIDTFVYDSYHEDISNELAACGLIADKSEAKETLGALYEQMTYLIEANRDGKGAEFAENHKADLEALNFICNRIDEVDITEAAIQQSKQAEKDIDELLKEMARDEANENRQKKNKDDKQVKE